MPKRRPPTRTRRNLDLEIDFERQVRRVPAPQRADLLAWLRAWRRQPGRVFWELDPTGRWRRLV